MQMHDYDFIDHGIYNDNMCLYSAFDIVLVISQEGNEINITINIEAHKSFVCSSDISFASHNV